MTCDEKQRLANHSFTSLWQELWGLKKINQYKSEEIVASKKFNQLVEGIHSATGIYTLKTLVDSSTTEWSETEWEFPKGRINKNEKDAECALREFEEETGYLKTDISLVSNIAPFDELFIGSNHKAYRHKYFLGHLTKEYTVAPNHQPSEVSKVAWCTLGECITNIRSYHVEKIRIISDIDCTIRELVV